MKLTNPYRAELSKIPFLNDLIDGLIAAITSAWQAQHTADGAHVVITERGRTVPLGTWTDLPSVATRFTASGTQTFTVTAGNVQVLKYAQVGLTTTIKFAILGASVGGAASPELRIALPTGVRVKTRADAPYISLDNGTYAVGWVLATANVDYLIFYRDPPGANWTASAGASGMFGEIAFETTP